MLVTAVQDIDSEIAWAEQLLSTRQAEKGTVAISNDQGSDVDVVDQPPPKKRKTVSAALMQ